MIRFLSEIQGKHMKLAKIVKISISFNRLVLPLKFNRFSQPLTFMGQDICRKLQENKKKWKGKGRQPPYFEAIAYFFDKMFRPGPGGGGWEAPFSTCYELNKA